MSVIQRSPSGRPVAQFPEPESVGARDWGDETLLVMSPGNYTMKRLFVQAGKKGGLQYHRMKDEASYIVSGQMLLRFENENGELIEKVVEAGDWFHFPAGCVHQEEAITDVVRIEVSTPHFNDRVRVEEEFGFEDSGGLPTTSIDQIERR